MFALLAIVLISLSTSKIVKTVTVTVLSIVLILNVADITECEINLKKQNAFDKAWCFSIVEEIKKYENVNGTEINTIVYSYDDEKDMNVSEKSFTESCAYFSWSIGNSIKYYTGRVFETKELDKEANPFENKNWTQLNLEEQLVFNGNTLYLCCY